jgi:hypothetical protein
MAEITKKVVGYMAFLPGSTDAPEVIRIFCEDDYSLFLVFQKKPTPGLINEYDTTNHSGSAYLEGISQYPHYIDLLRNEGPLAVLFVPDDTPPQFNIYTIEKEGIGEGEIASTLDQIRNRL